MKHIESQEKTQSKAHQDFQKSPKAFRKRETSHMPRTGNEKSPGLSSNNTRRLMSTGVIAI
jgi:hypothetical protein